ncbi:MAG: tRNA uridine-5-carboxymethylaminomethyl(34) synthesis GTPase MnmE [Hyphomicrobiales bacterium]|nr:tRNA uridine-5-carboxymethylaminomethyl(34) synthesis GTPase MnmE [Hyphomicrobiales bacterium]
MAESDTIFALATPPGRSALAVFRISGAQAGYVLEMLSGRAVPEARRVVLRAISDPDSGERIDTGLATFFKGPASFTGEDLLELTVHGGRGVINAVSSILRRFEKVRTAEPGEFTRRAYSAGKFDLAQAEAIADLIDSETEFQRRQALRLLDNGLGRRAEVWRQSLLQIAVELESVLDFSDEGDVGEAQVEGLVARAEELRLEIVRARDAGARSLALRNGFTVVIAGPPNVGKSTLFNLLAGSELAIVTEYAGTTRDLLSTDLDLDGVPVKLVDTAGVRVALDPVEAIGVERARSAIGSADLVVRLQSGDVDPFDEAAPGDLVVWSKADRFAPPKGVIAISSVDFDSISKLIKSIRERALNTVGDGSEGMLTRQRHLDALAISADALGRLIEASRGNRLELAAEECRDVNVALGSISGSFGAEELLGAIFARFCIGK